ncbi:alpha/beta fold hydrolase [Rhabdobacter roseus]|uniref:Pimeloyl-ACP methyl ester carboxylesterase n=1 Tax=Rhabdobacter roseus TaxID=1655419 RepID=A0A840TMX6_9BACT|nr:alpha/beta hydrolase [Rhabdobacter roseus]MBB5282892.1 pimeloyl-ACP methyl ester carboxylesterase [Rhabdobacter roseus]
MPTIQTNGISLYYEERGLGEPVLLIMGITAAGSVWEPHVADWEKYYRCILPDNRGVGFSDKPDGPYTTEQMADDYAGLLDQLGLEKVRVVGCSMGSTIAMQLALRHPHKVKSMVLMCPWARCDAMAKGIFEHMMHCKARFTPEEFSLYIQLLIFSKSTWDKDEKRAELEAGRRENPPFPQPLHGLQGQAAACINHHVLDQLGTVQSPTLVIGGEEDVFTPPWMGQEIAEAIPGAEIYLYQKLGHAFHFEATEDFNNRVKEWLDKH